MYFLHQKGVTRLDVVNFISHGITKVPQTAPAKPQPESEADSDQEQNSGGALEKLHAQPECACDLRQDRSADRARARTGAGNRRRCAAGARTTRYWWAKPGVGKTAIAEGLARRIIEGAVPEILATLPGLRAGHGIAAGGNKVPGRFRAALEGGSQAAHRQSERHSVHRRDPYADRRRGSLRGNARCLQSAEARAVARATSSASVRRPIPSTVAFSKRITRCRAASRRSM